MQVTENLRGNRQEGYRIIMTMSGPIQPGQLRRELKNYYNWNFLNIRLTVPSDCHLFGALKTHLGGKSFADDKQAETEVQDWLRQQSKGLYAAGFTTIVKQ
jgi:hypothetical protein